MRQVITDNRIGKCYLTALEGTRIEITLVQFAAPDRGCPPPGGLPRLTHAQYLTGPRGLRGTSRPAYQIDRAPQDILGFDGHTSRTQILVDFAASKTKHNAGKVASADIANQWRPPQTAA